MTSVMIVDAQATPRMAAQVIEKFARSLQTISHVVLTHIMQCACWARQATMATDLIMSERPGPW